MPKIKVIYIEDEVDKYLVRYLTKEDFDVIEAQDVDDAWEKLNNVQPDVVLLDIMMPPGDKFAVEKDVDDGFRTGLVLLRHLRKSFPQLPVVVLTANPDANVREETEKLGVYRYALKGWNESFTDVSQWLRNALRERNG
jgi:two-component system, NtrC family, response regulator HydG